MLKREWNKVYKVYITMNSRLNFSYLHQPTRQENSSGCGLPVCIRWGNIRNRAGFETSRKGWKTESTFRLAWIKVIRDWNGIIAGTGKSCLKMDKEYRNILIKMLKLYLYCNFLRVSLAFDVYSIYLCRVFTYKQELIYINRKRKKEGEGMGSTLLSEERVWIIIKNQKK